MIIYLCMTTFSELLNLCDYRALLVLKRSQFLHCMRVIELPDLCYRRYIHDFNRVVICSLITRIAVNASKFKLVDKDVPVVLPCHLSFETDTVILLKFIPYY